MIAFSAQLFVMPTFFSLFKKKRQVRIEIDSQGQACLELPSFTLPITIESASVTFLGVILRLKDVDHLSRLMGLTLWCPPWYSHKLALCRWVIWLSRSPVEA